jgi:hypothetical protein
LKLYISTRKIIIWLIIMVVALNLIGFIGRGVENYLGYERTTPFVRLFHVTGEGNITSWFSSLILLFSAIVLLVIAKTVSARGGPYIKHWYALSIIFAYLALDEAASIHELTMDPLRNLLHPTGIFHFAWVIIAIPLVLLFVIVYIKFLFYLPKDTRWLFLVGGFLYVFGAMGMDMVAGFILDNDLVQGRLYGLLITIEEFLENVGIVTFIYALLSYLTSHLGIQEISVELS